MPRDTGGTLTQLRRHAASWRSGTGNQAAACDHRESLLFMERPGQGFKEGVWGETVRVSLRQIFLFSVFFQ